MIQCDEFLSALKRHDFDLISGVPCSYLTPLINGTLNSTDVRYVNAGNEGEAVAIATGATLAGLGGVAMFQNSGLGNTVSPLTSLNWVFRIPILLIVTWRGEPGGVADEPQHELMGRITHDQLRLMEIHTELFPGESSEIDAVLANARDVMKATSRSVALVMRKGSVAPQKLNTNAQNSLTPGIVVNNQHDSTPIDPDDALLAIQKSVQPSDILIATTGFTGRALYACGDFENQLYMVGSMGCASSLGLGLAIAQPNRRVIVIDGDGSLLMRTGALAAVGRAQPANFVHVLLNNGVHDSTGSQATLASAVDFPAIAAACGYPQTFTARDISDFTDLISHKEASPRFVQLMTSPRSDRKLPRPEIKPELVAKRLQRFLGVSSK